MRENLTELARTLLDRKQSSMSKTFPLSNELCTEYYEWSVLQIDVCFVVVHEYDMQSQSKHLDRLGSLAVVCYSTFMYCFLEGRQARSH